MSPHFVGTELHLSTSSNHASSDFSGSLKLLKPQHVIEKECFILFVCY